VPANRRQKFCNAKKARIHLRTNLSVKTCDSAARARHAVPIQPRLSPGADAPPQRLGPLVASLSIVLPIAWLCWLRGGVDPATHNVVFGIVLTLSALLFAFGPRLGIDVRLPWPVVTLAILPVLQLAPLGPARTNLWQPWREDLYRTFASLGVESASSTSLYPLATLRAAVVLAGCCALFGMAQAVARHGSRTVIAIVASWLVVAAGDAVLGLAQILEPSPGPSAGLTAIAHGTFVNRNHFAVLLEAGFCLSIGLAVFLNSRVLSPAGIGARWAVWSAHLAGGLCVVGIAASGSRMGIVVGAGAAVAATIIFARLTKRSWFLLPAGFLVLLLATALSLPGAAQGFARLIHDQGDPGRVAIWSDALATAARHFPAGSGLGTFAFAFRRGALYFPRNTIDHAHCDWLEFLVELGPAGALFLTGSIAAAFFAVCRRPKRDALVPFDPLRKACLLAAGAILLHGTVDFPFQIPALAALFSVLLGCAAGLADRGELPGNRPATRWAAALGCCLFALAAAAVDHGKPGSWNAEALFDQGQHALLDGQSGAAGQQFRASLAANPYAALVWQKRAELARVSGNDENEIKLLDLASRLEPFTFRTEWPAAQSLLRQRRWDQASTRLRTLAEVLPDFQPAIFRAALQAEMPAARITTQVVPANAAGVWLRLLADVEAWDEFGETLAQRCFGEASVSPQDLRYLLDKLFERRRQRLLIDLWQAAPSPEEPDLELNLPASLGQSAPLSHYFAVTPGTGYVLEAQVSTENWAGAEAWLEVRSIDRLLESSPPIRRSTPWHGVTLQFRPQTAQILRLSVVSRSVPGSAARGRLQVRYIRVRRTKPAGA
jgi:hypothetical protein